MANLFWFVSRANFLFGYFVIDRSVDVTRH